MGINPENEKREFLRGQAAFPLVYDVITPYDVKLLFGDKEREAVASNLSEGGLLLFTGFDLPLGTVVLLKFGLLVGDDSPTNSRKLELHALARHSRSATKNSYFVGVRFIRLSDSDRAFLARVLGHLGK